MTEKQFEEFIKKAIIESYIEVMGVDKWLSLTDEQKYKVLHTLLVDLTNSI